MGPYGAIFGEQWHINKKTVSKFNLLRVKKKKQVILRN